MAKIGEPEEGVLKEHPRAVVHMRHQLSLGRFGLVLGSGVSKPLRLPDWQSLIEKLAADDAIRGTEVIKSPKSRDPQSSRAQMLFQHFRAREYALQKPAPEACEAFDRELRLRWIQLVHECLYREFDSDLLEKHPYIHDFVDIIRRSPLTVNYNFDDVIQQTLRKRSQADTLDDLGFETVWKSTVQHRRSRCVLYHPNGFLPQNLLENASDDIVLSEDSFADQLLASMSGHYSHLLNHLARTTCLFVGLSLEDSLLKHLLRQCGRLNPGHYHYYVAYVEPGEVMLPERREAIRAANFDVYNLITLFLDSDGIAALGRLVTAEGPQFKNCARECGVPTRFCFYLCGAVGAGKSTSLEHFHSLTTHAEWFDERLPELAIPAEELDVAKRDNVDTWIASQFAKKNRALLDSEDGIHIVDRCPLDPLAFTPPQEWLIKARRILDAIGMRKSKHSVASGRVVFLEGDPHTMWIRNIRRHRKQRVNDIQFQQSALKDVYDLEGHIRIDTRNLSILEVVKRVAHVVHLDDYSACGLQERLEEVAAGTFKPTTHAGA